VIRLEGVSRTYAIGGGTLAALADVTEHVAVGEHVAIMGPSGSGKSTLLNIIGCLDRPSSGRYWLDGREVGGLSEDELTLVRRHTIGFIFQFFHLVPRLSALENVELPMVFADVARGERRARAAEALAAVGLADRVTHRPDQLSGGERQRVAIARAMIMRPRLLLADEPTGNLDSASGAQVLEMLDRLHAGGLTLLVVTHDPQVARRAQRTLVMADGRVVRRLTSEQLRDAGPAWGSAAGS
jgi:putative ABC transport system ATP-binding protein